MAQPGHPRTTEVLDWSPVSSPPKPIISGPARIGTAIIFLFCGVFLVWGSWAPLSGGTIASGAIAPDGSVRTVQHLEGGIVKELFVRDGTHVKRGDPLVALEDLAYQAEYESMSDQLRARLAEAARLDAEFNDTDAITFPGSLVSDPKAADVIRAEQQVFRARRDMLATRTRVLTQRVHQLEEQIAGFQSQIAGTQRQLAFLREEIADKQTLLDKGLMQKSELLRLRREEAELTGLKGEYLANAARARQQIGETEIELRALTAERMEQASSRASEIRGEVVRLRTSLEAQKDVLTRSVIKSPLDGIVSGLSIRTVGGVLRPGEPILNVVPTDEELMIDAHVRPTDVDDVEVGMAAEIRFSGLSGRSSQRIMGVVRSVAADSAMNSVTGQNYFKTRVAVTREELEKTGESRFSVGMPAEVVIVAETRTMMQFLLEPLADAVRRAGREL